MPDSTPMIEQMAAVIRALPTAANGDFRVENPEALAVEFVNIVAPMYQTELDSIEARALAAEAAHRMGDDETTALRADVDALRDVVSRASGHLDTGDAASAKVVLDGATAGD